MIGPISIGSRVKDWFGTPGRITDISEEYITVQYEDGDQEVFPATELRVNHDLPEIEPAPPHISHTYITHISVKGLFGYLDHELSLNPDESVAILTAPNGYGKTTMFKLLRFLFDPQMATLSTILRIYFDSFTCKLTDGLALTLRHPSSSQGMFFSLEQNGQLKGECSLFDSDGGERFCFAIRSLLGRYRCACHLIFIDANRLQPPPLPGEEDKLIDRLDEMNQVVAKYVRYWIDLYNEKLEWGRTFLLKLYLETEDVPPTDENFQYFKDKWDVYQDALRRFQELDLISSSELSIPPSELRSAFQKRSTFLNAYAEVYSIAQDILEGCYRPLKLMTDIFNQRNAITGKTLRITADGLKIYTHGREIVLGKLSSGEKNDLLMFSQLIFSTPENSIVLIDEPEISLHIEWQEEYIDRLLEICKLNNLRSIVSTHSPNIINGHFELLIEKG